MHIGAVTAKELPGSSSALASALPPILHGSLPSTTLAPAPSVHPVAPLSTPALGAGVYSAKSPHCAKLWLTTACGVQSYGLLTAACAEPVSMSASSAPASAAN